MFLVVGVIASLGGLFHVNPIWLYGPFVPYAARSPAQPDWYMGWIEGLVRLAPSWTEFTVFGYVVAEPFIPAVVVPGILFATVALWPALERRVTKDHEMHNLLQHPRDAPVRTGIGAAGLTLMVLLTLAGSNDVLAKFLQVEVDTLNDVFKILLVRASARDRLRDVSHLCRARARGSHPIRHPRRMLVRWNAEGGFDDVEVDEHPEERV